MIIEKRKNKIEGVTLVTLSITIILLLILMGIGISTGNNTIKKAKLEELKTNMLLIQAKAREYVEEVNFRMGIGSEEEKLERRNTARQEIYVDTEKLRKADSVPEKFGIEELDMGAWYYLTAETKERWGLKKLDKEEQYLIRFDEANIKVEVYNIEGYEGNYSLSAMDQIQE